jgi:hypothetical protein
VEVVLLEGLTPPRKELSCRIRKVMEGLEPDDQKILRLSLEDFDSWPAKTLERALKLRGVILSEGPIRKHRNRKCSCFRETVE